MSQGLSRSQAELRSVQPAWTGDETNAAQVHCPSTSFGQVLLNGSQVQVPWTQRCPVEQEKLQGTQVPTWQNAEVAQSPSLVHGGPEPGGGGGPPGGGGDSGSVPAAQ